jgi:hypothetical protein
VTARLTWETWGSWPSMRLATDRVALTVVPAIGGRVVSLADLRTGREWLVQGTPLTEDEARSWSAEDAVFGGRVSFGWDECLPTVAPCPDPLAGGAAPLRDHGDQWGRPTETVWHEAASALETRWPLPRWRYEFTRTLSFEDDTTVLAEYSLRNPTVQPRPVLWSIHPVLKLEPGSRIDVPDVDRARLTWANGLGDGSREVGWPWLTRADGSTVDLSLVSTDEGWAAKLYVRSPRAVRADAPDGSSLEVDWDHEVAPALGIWLSYGDGRRERPRGSRWPWSRRPLRTTISREPCRPTVRASSTPARA